MAKSKANKTTKKATKTKNGKTTSQYNAESCNWRDNRFCLFFAQLFCVIICIIINVLIAMCLSKFLYGDEVRYIADYMPGDSLHMDAPWDQVVARQLRMDLILPFFAALILTGFEAFLLYRLRIFRKNWVMFAWMIPMIVVPLIPAGIQIASLYAFTS